MRKSNNNYKVVINQDRYNKIADVYYQILLLELIGMIEDNMQSMTDEDVRLNGFNDVSQLMDIIDLDYYEGSSNINHLQVLVNSLDEYITIQKED